MPWKRIASDLNESFNCINPKNPSQCAERWKNYLMKKYKKFFFYDFVIFITFNSRGEWTKEEDLKILSYVRKNGTKWSKLAKICPERTEHNVKNRFFSLLAKHFDSPILEIKERFNYTDPKTLTEVILSLK